MAPAHSKDFWDAVLDQLRKRRSVKLAAALLGVLYALVCLEALEARLKKFEEDL